MPDGRSDLADFMRRRRARLAPRASENGDYVVALMGKHGKLVQDAHLRVTSAMRDDLAGSPDQ